MRPLTWIAPAALALACLWACQGEEKPADKPRVRGPGEPRRVFIDRILISYRGNPFDIQASRSLAEARALANRVYRRARAGDDFARLRNENSDDRRSGTEVANGPYILLNYDVPIAPTMPTVPRMERMSMGRRLGDRAVGMLEGDIILVDYDEGAYPAGFEIIRCLKRDDRTEAQVAADLKKPREPPK